MRLNIHDYSGHPFQVQLSRDLAARGHDVLHGYSTQYVTGHGNLQVGPHDSPTLRIEGITADAEMVKYSPVGRMRFEMSYAQAWQRALDEQSHDVVVACNVPMFALARMRRYFERRNQRWVLWHQDVHSLGVAAEADRKLPGQLAGVTGRQAQRVEAAQVRSADAVVAIGDGFVVQYRDWGVPTRNVHVIKNWAPLSELVPGVRDNDWARRQGLPVDAVRLLYAGTLGRKHNPQLLLELLDAVRARGVNATLTVVSEGVGAEDLRAAADGRSDVRILGYQPAEELSDVLASADAVIALLEPDAAQFSVPSKVLSYMSAGRPIIALVPGGNPAALDVDNAGGCVAPPTVGGAHEAADWLCEVVKDPEGLALLGKKARHLAERRFNIERIGDRFEAILFEAADRSRRVGSAFGAVHLSPARAIA